MTAPIEQIENDDKPNHELELCSVTSSYPSDLDVYPTTLSMLAISSQQSLAWNKKSKYGIRSFLHKVFGLSKNSLTNQETKSEFDDSLNINFINETAYPILRPLPITQGPIRLFILRHGERLDYYYSSQWLQQAFDKNGNFCRFSPILPESVPSRASIYDFALDPPLTFKGLKDAYHTGTVLREKNIDIHYCYSSPSLGCVQTATKLLEGLQSHHKLKIRIEPGLLEYITPYTTDETINDLTIPRFLTKKELLENQYPIEKNYHEQMNISDISPLETEFDYYERSHHVTTSIQKLHENELITQIQQEQVSVQDHLHILFIAHAPTLETCTRKLCGGKFLRDRLHSITRNIDFLTMTIIEKTDNNCDQWIFRRSSFYDEKCFSTENK
ncbi:hypothetical protein I4U23_024810 [Adineta vaga]|nr:hypothetical protein I4U23_024810 [Adineta vaga]